MKRFLKNKKGQESSGSGFDASSSAFYWALILGILILILVLFIFLFRGYIDSLSPIPINVEHDMITARVLNSCFITQNETMQQYHLTIIDINKYNQTLLEECFYSSPQPSFSTRLQIIDHPIATPNLRLRGGGELITYQRIVLVHVDDQIKTGIMEVKFNE